MAKPTHVTSLMPVREKDLAKSECTIVGRKVYLRSAINRRVRSDTFYRHHLLTSERLELLDGCSLVVVCDDTDFARRAGGVVVVELTSVTGLARLALFAGIGGACAVVRVFPAVVAVSALRTAVGTLRALQAGLAHMQALCIAPVDPHPDHHPKRSALPSTPIVVCSLPTRKYFKGRRGIIYQAQPPTSPA